jgi:CelD/BcsL family acetyltransferase involved in cellulose biosynthesis
MKGTPKSGSRVLTSWSDFHDLRAPWEELVTASGASLFVSHPWLSVWSRVFGRDYAPRIIQVWRDGQLVAAAPLGIVRHRVRHLPVGVHVRCLSMLADRQTPFSQWLVAPGHEDSIMAMLQVAAEKCGDWEMCEFEPVLEDPDLTGIRDAAAHLRWSSTWSVINRSVVADTSDGWDAYLARRSTNTRKNIRKARRALATTEHRWWRGDEGDAEVLERIFVVSQRSWKGKVGTAIGVNGELRSFYRGLWNTFGPMGKMDLCLLEIGGSDAGSIMAIRHRDTAYAMKMAFGEEYKVYSPGRLVLASLIEWSAASGLRAVDMLRHSPFTGEFSDGGYRLGRLRLFRRTNLPALWYSLEDFLRPIGSRWRHDRRRGRRARRVRAARGS